VLKKKNFNEETEIPIFDEAIIYLRDGHWQFRMYLPTERKYVVRSLKTKNRAIAIAKGKDLFHDIHAEVRNGKKLFSMTAKEAVTAYLKFRQIDVDHNTIVVGRLTTITAHLNHFLDFIKRDTRLRDLEADSAIEYAGFRLGENASISTIANEQSTINALRKWLHLQGHMSFQSFIFRPLKMVDSRADDVRRQTFTDDELDTVLSAAEDYVDAAQERNEDYLHRQLTSYWININAHAGLRNGEARQMRWSDIEDVKDPKHYKEELLFIINIRPETSKVRSTRRVICQGGGFLAGLKTLLKPKGKDALVFSIDGVTEFAEKHLLKHFYAILEIAGIDYRGRNIVPYSLRHYMITNRLRAGLQYRQVAKMVGNSASEIEKTYHHLFDDERIESALAERKPIL
jgi:integrase